jgi:hypothetical protein
VDLVKIFTINTNPGNYVSVGGEVQVRIRWIPTTDLEAADGWTEQVDHSTLAIQ